MIEVIIPTYNFPDRMVNVVEGSLKKYNGKEFKITILDSSTNDDTLNLVKPMLSNPIFKYQRIDSSLNSDQKSIQYIKECKEDYYWLLGDGNIVNFNEVEKQLINLKYENYDVVVTDFATRHKDLEKDSYKVHEYKDGLAFVETDYSYWTYWGGDCC